MEGSTVLSAIAGLLMLAAGAAPQYFVKRWVAGLVFWGAIGLAFGFAIYGNWDLIRNPTPQTLVTLGFVGVVLSGCLALGGMWWQRNAPIKAAPPPLAGSATGMTIDGLDGLVPGQVGQAETESSKFYTPEDRRRILEALYKVNQINTVDCGKILRDTRTIYSDWYNRKEGLNAAKAAETIQQLEKNDQQFEAVRTKLYREIYAEYEMYWDIILPTLEVGLNDGKSPLNGLQTSLQKMIGELRNFIIVLEKYSISEPSPELTSLTWRASDDVNTQTKMFEDWIGQNSRRIKEASEKFRAAQ